MVTVCGPFCCMGVETCRYSAMLDACSLRPRQCSRDERKAFKARRNPPAFSPNFPAARSSLTASLDRSEWQPDIRKSCMRLEHRPTRTELAPITSFSSQSMHQDPVLPHFEPFALPIIVFTRFRQEVVLYVDRLYGGDVVAFQHHSTCVRRDV